MKVAVVGAGVAGLAAARTLIGGGAGTVVFEQASVPGGRVATVRHGGYVFDSGATSVTPRGLSIGTFLASLPPSTTIQQVTLPVYVHDGHRAAPGSNSRTIKDRYTFGSGMDRLALLLADGLDVRYGSKVSSVTLEGRVNVDGETFDAVVLAVPTRIAEELTLGHRKFPSATYRPSICVLLGLDAALATPYFATVEPDQVHPLTWLSIESRKCGGRAPEGKSAVVAQMSSAYSRLRMDSDDQKIIDETAFDVLRLLQLPDQEPEVAKVVRFRTSHAESLVSWEAANPLGTKLLLAGDAVGGARIELSYESGVRAARQILEGK